MNGTVTEIALSVIVATYNSEATIRRCLESIELQDFHDLEVVVVDGGSKDQTMSFVNEFRARLRIVSLSEKDSGVYDAWNKALRLSKGRWLTFIGSDDVYIGSQGLRKLVDAGSESAEAPFIYSQLVSVSINGDLVHVHGADWRDPFGFYQQHLSAQLPFPTMGTIFRRTFIGDDLFDESYKVAGDLELILRQLKKWRGSAPVFVPLQTVEMGMGGISTNDAYFWRALSEDFRFRRGVGMSVLNLGLWTNVLKRTIMSSGIKLFGRKNYEFALGAFRKARARLKRLSY